MLSSDSLVFFINVVDWYSDNIHVLRSNLFQIDAVRIMLLNLTDVLKTSHK